MSIELLKENVELQKQLLTALANNATLQEENANLRKKTINYDDEGVPVSVTVEGRGTFPVKTNAEGAVESIGEGES